MPASPEAFDVLASHIKGTTNRRLQDGLLDIWIDYRDRATEWDADKWGFTRKWMRAELQEMNRRPFDEERLRI
jgi:hypothetical protein